MMDNDQVNKTRLHDILHQTQCPLMPRLYDRDGEVSNAYYFNGEMWKDIGSDSCKIIVFSKEKQKRKAMDDAELMMEVDKYISHVHISTSTEIHQILHIACLEARTSFDDGDPANDHYQQLIPSNLGMNH